MDAPIASHSATYAYFDDAGERAGGETLEYTVGVDNVRVQSRLAIGGPNGVRAELDWTLELDLRTRLLHIFSQDILGSDYELELAVTGNGVLAHRRAPDGPTQVELGWGARTELDYLSAAFAAVTIARSRNPGGERREASVLNVNAAELVPDLVERVYLRLGDESFECFTPATGHRARILVDARGALLRYGDVVQCEELAYR